MAPHFCGAVSFWDGFGGFSRNGIGCFEKLQILLKIACWAWRNGNVHRCRVPSANGCGEFRWPAGLLLRFSNAPLRFVLLLCPVGCCWRFFSALVCRSWRADRSGSPGQTILLPRRREMQWCGRTAGSATSWIRERFLQRCRTARRLHWWRVPQRSGRV